MIELSAARRAADLEARRLAQARRALAAGESDGVVLAQTRLQDLDARQTVLASLANAQHALAALEDSIQRPLDSGDIGAFTFPAPQPDFAQATNKR